MKSGFLSKKIILATLLTMFLLVSLFFPKGVQAQMVVTDIPKLVQDAGKWIWEKAGDAIKLAWKHGGAIAYRNAINLYLGQMAEQTAEYVATGGKGQKPMFLTDPDYWTKLGDQVLGEWIDQTAKSFTGVSLCDPVDPTIKFNMLVGLDVKNKGMMFKPEMRCSWSNIKERAKELSKKKLIDFDIELKEGRAAYYKRLTNYVEADPWLTTEGKKHVLWFANWLGTKADKIVKDSELLTSIVDGTKEVSDAVLKELKDGWSESLDELKFQVDAFQNIEIIKKAGECIKYDKDKFCGDKTCRALYAVGKSEGKCKDNWEDYNKIATETRKVALQALDIAETIINGTEKVLENFGDFSPTAPPTLEDINREYNPEASDLAVMFQLESKLFKKQAEEIEKSKFMRTITGEMNRLTSKISNLTLTPAEGVRSTWESSIKDGTAGVKEYTGVAVADAVGVFTNTLVQKLLKQAFEKGLNPAVSPEVITRLSLDRPTTEQSQALYADLTVVSIKRGGEISIYDEFAVCPTEKKYALSTNCLIDNLLVRALEEGLTIQEAMDKSPVSFLSSNNQVGLPGDKDSLLSWPNIKKLRRFRIFPLGLEIAAYKLSHPGLYSEMGNVQKNLQQLINDFHNPDSHFYHLVDPNWVLKKMTYKCGARGYSAVPVSGSTDRQETCLDLKDCIHEDDSGQCDTWAYCTREKNIWKINGDTCDSQYASCQTYEKTSDNSQISYLTNTLDFEGCDENNVGCKWYCSHWDENLVGGDWACLDSGLSRKVLFQETCNLTSACLDPEGCLCTRTAGDCLVALNEDNCTYPVFNEYEDTNNSIFFNNKVEECSIQDVNCHEYIRTDSRLGTNLIFNGSFELDTINNDTNKSGSDDIPDGWKVPSASWNGLNTINSDYNVNGSVSYKFENITNYTGVWQLVEVVPGKEYTISAKIRVEALPTAVTINYYFDDNGDGDYIQENQGETAIILDEDYLNSWQSHVQTIIIPDNMFYVWIAPIMYGDGIVYFDDIKFETGVENSLYQYYGEENKIYLKDALPCQSNEVGCELYTSNNEDPKIPGIVNEQDKCLFNCLGYETFQQMPSYFDSNSIQLVNLIPSTAKTCSFPGCEEFTNLDIEKREYYSYLRQCIKVDSQGQVIIDSDGNEVENPPTDFCQLYYTWVGTETGYQLKQYYLEKAEDGPMKVNESPNLEWGDCEDLNDALVNPHCQQFYDAAGNIYYRLYKNTISCTESCSPYRRTIDKERQMANALEGDSCNKQNIGCLEYKGPTAGNVYQVFLHDFELKNVLESEQDISFWTSGESSPVSINYGGHSLYVESSKTSRLVADLVNKNKTYFVSFWIKGTNEIDVSFSSLSKISKTNLNLGDWQEVKLGPFSFNTELKEDEKLIITSTDSFYIDNIILKEIRDNLYLIKDSWQTPCECDTLANHEEFLTGTRNCSLENAADFSMVGCQTYQDREGRNHWLKSFAHLCSEAVVGCEALIDTQNSSIWPLSQNFNKESSAPEDDILIPADDLVYLINDKEKECGEKNKGCQKFGLPELNLDKEVISYTDIYLINDPDSYVSSPTLCFKENLGCEGYEGPIYFKDPGDKVCEYRENVIIGIIPQTGWFKKETNQACYYNSDSTAYAPNGMIYGIHSSNDSEYKGWAGICPIRQSGCTEFIDPLSENLAPNPSFELDGDSDGVPNEYIRNDGIPSDGTSFLDKDVFYDGEFSYKISNATPPPPPPAPGFNYGLKHDVGIKVLPQTKYEVSAYVKTVGIVNGSVNLDLHCHNIDHTGGDRLFEKIPGDWSINTKTTSNPEWVRIGGTIITEDSADHCHILLIFSDNTIGTAYFDTVKFVEEDYKDASYYYLNNNKITSAKADCQNMVGTKDGCILFNDTSQKDYDTKQNKDTLIYDSIMTYANSLIRNDLQVPVVQVEAGQGDSNVVLKVKRDRTCGEWLTCLGEREVWDKNIGDWYNSCEFIARCDKLIGSGEGSGCSHYVFNSDPKPLTEKTYTDRNISWSGMDYSGHSLFKLYPIELLFPKDESGVYELTYQGNGIGEGKPTIEKTCKIFPEKDSPFKQDNLITDFIPQNDYYKDVNVCYQIGSVAGSEFDYSDCQCAYKKVEYSGITRYYNYEEKDDIASGICVGVSSGGKEMGEDCTNNTECGEAGGYCSIKSKETLVLGVRGFCLEKDESKIGDINSCLTWWPGPGVGDPDIYQNYIEAAYTADPNRQWYCSGSTYAAAAAEWTNVTGDKDDKHCDRHVDGCEEYGETLLPAGLKGKIKKYEIDKIEIDLMGNDAENVCAKHWDDDMILEDSNGDGIDDKEDWWACGGYDKQGGHDPCSEHDTFGCSCEDGGCCMNVQAQFDSNDFLTGFLFKAKNESSSKGSAGHRNVDIYLKDDGCKYLLKIPAGNNNIVKGAYTNRLWPESSYYQEHGGSTSCAPYGAANFKTIPDDRLVFPGEGTKCVSSDGIPADSPIRNDLTKLKDIFSLINLDESKRFNKETMLYENENPDPEWNYMFTDSSESYAPKVASVDMSTCNDERQCNQLNLDSLTIGIQDTVNIARPQNYIAPLRFYAWADTNHMPIRNITIDWLGDKSQEELIRSYFVVAQNHKPKSKCDDSTFGSSLNEACTDKYFQFGYTYHCENSDSIGWENSQICPGVTNACCFKPTVYIKDNWDWCNGNGGVYAGDGDCLSVSSGTSYKGVIIIRP